MTQTRHEAGAQSAQSAPSEPEGGGVADSGLPAPAEQLTELAARYGTPLYVYELERVDSAAESLTAALPRGVGLRYSLKANPHSAIVARLAARGLDPEISSSGELAAVRRAGVATDRCLYTGPGKTAVELDAALRAGVRLFSVESSVDRDRLAAAAVGLGAEVEYLIRVNAGGPTGGDGLRMSGVPSQFGVDVGILGPGHGLLRSVGPACPVGLHFFAASNAAGPETLLSQFAENLSAAAYVESLGLPLRWLELGGGFPAPFAVPGRQGGLASLCDPLTALLDGAFAHRRDDRPRVGFESGRALAAGCGVLLTSVLDVKQARGQTYVVLDAGVETLGGMSGLGRLLVPGVVPVALERPGDAADDRHVEASLVGPLCTPLDVHNRRVVLPVPRVGQLLAVPNVGAYGPTAGLLGFLSRPVAAEVVLDGGEVASARRLELTETELAR